MICMIPISCFYLFHLIYQSQMQKKDRDSLNNGKIHNQN